MNKKIKIVTIGGGSSYTPELIEGFIKRSSKLDIEELWLVDIEEGKEKLEIVGGLAQRMVKAAGLDWKVHLTLDRREALKNADFVTTQFRVGLLDARIRDEKIPTKYGMMGQETNGAGGIFKALRTIPVILDIIKDMRELCPDAWLVNFTNPSGMVTEAAIKVGGWEKTVGLCNVPLLLQKRNNDAYGLDPDDETTLLQKFAGLNHFHWHRVWDHEGKEITMELFDDYYGPNATYPERAKVRVKHRSPIGFVYEQARDFNMLINENYHRWYFTERDMLEDNLAESKCNQTRGQVVKEVEKRLFEIYKNQELHTKPKELEERGGTYYSDAACELISAIVNDSRKVMDVCTVNNGAITDLPYDCIVEITSVITSHGPEPFNWGKCPTAMRGWLQIMKAMEELTIEAAVSGDYGKALQAFTINPLVRGGSDAQAMMNEMLVANKKYLPQFALKIKELEAAGVTYDPKEHGIEN